MSRPELAQVAGHLRSLIRGVIPAELLARDAGAAGAFRDERSNRLAVDAPLLASAFDLPLEDAEHADESSDLRLWRAAIKGGPGPVELAPGSAAPLCTHPPRVSIEVWTEAELSALHALWRIARVTGRDDLRTRCIDAAIWHAENTQPDNATNHPWAAHVFHIASEATGVWELQHYAQTLVHNAMIGGRVRVRSAIILLDCARELERLIDPGHAAPAAGSHG